MSAGSSTAGCWTPRGIMELGQRIYPSGCSRIVCKKLGGEPIIEHQFCKTSTSDVPENCILSQREWLRYPDCCPELHCSPAPTGMNQDEKSFLVSGHKTQAYDPEGSTSTNLGKFDRPAVTPSPKLYMTTEIVYGVGFSKPFQPTTQTPDAENEPRYQHSDILDSSLTRYYDSPGNTLNGWDDGKRKEELVTEIPYQYKEDFSDSTPADPRKVTPYVITYPTTSGLAYLLTANNSSSPLYHFFNNAEHVLTSPLPYRQNVYESTPITPRAVTYPSPQPVRPAPLPGETHQSADENPTTYLVKDTEVSTQKPYIKPTTYSPPSDLWNRFKTTPSGWRKPSQHTFRNDAAKVTTPTIEWAPKTTKNYFKQTTKDVKNPTHYLTKFSPSPKYDIYATTLVKNVDATKRPVFYKTTERPTQRVTKTERIPSVSTPAPQKTTPTSYEFATPKLNPNNHDLVEFIHSTLDPSALIPGHDVYIKSKYDSKKEYIRKSENVDDQHRKRKRSLSYEDSTSPYDMDTESPIDTTERRGRPMFYIPWRDDAENDIVTELTTTMDLNSTKSQPLTKFEQASYILQALATTSKPSLTVVNTQVNETTNSDNKVGLTTVQALESANFSKFQNLTGRKMQSETTAGIESKENITTIEPQKNETRKEQSAENQEAIVSEQMNGNTSKADNISEEATDSSLQINQNETATKNPFITHATLSSTTALPETSYESTTKIIIIEAIAIEEPGDTSAAESMKAQGVTKEPSIIDEDKIVQQESSTADSLEIYSVTDSPVNTASNNRGRRLPNSRRKSQRRHRGQQVTPSKIRGNAQKTEEIRGNPQSQENQAELALQKTEPQLGEEILSRSAPRQRQSWNQRQNSENGRTRAYVPVLNYERKYERNNSDISQLEPKASTITLQNSSSYENTPTVLENYNTPKGGYRAASLPGPVTTSHSKKENSMSRDDGQRLETARHKIDNASDHIRKQSSSQFTMHETRSKYHPGRQMGSRARSSPRSYDRSEFSSAMGSTHAVEHMEDSYQESEVYSSNSGNSQGSARHFLQPQMFKTYSQNKAETNSNVPVSASSTRDSSRSYIHDGQRGYSNTFPEVTSKQSIPVNNGKPSFNKWFTDIFGDNQQPKDRANSPGIGPHLPQIGNVDVHPSRSESKFTISENYAQNTRTHYSPGNNRHLRNNSSGVANSQKSFSVPQRPTAHFNDGHKRESFSEQTETPWAALEKHFATSSQNVPLVSYSSNSSAQNTFLGKTTAVLSPETSKINSDRLSSIFSSNTKDRNSTIPPEIRLQNTYIKAATDFSNTGNDSNVTREVPKIYEARNPARYRPSTNKPVSRLDLDEVQPGSDFQISGNEDNTNGTQILKAAHPLGGNNRRRTPGTLHKKGARNRTPTTPSSFDNSPTSAMPPKYPNANQHVADPGMPAVITTNNPLRQIGFPQNRFSFHQQDPIVTSTRPSRARSSPKIASLNSGNHVPSNTGNANVNQPAQPSWQPNVRTNTRQRSASLTNNPSASQSAQKSASFSPWETVKPAYKPAPLSDTNPGTHLPPPLPAPEDPTLAQLDFWEPQRKDS